jgi:hypothetical protein
LIHFGINFSQPSRARIIRLLVERVEIRAGGADIRLRVAGLATLVRDLGERPDTSALAAA